MTGNLLMIGAFVLSVVLMLAGIVAFKYWRNRDARRSPLHGKKLANLPGQQLAARMNDHGDNLILAGIVMYLSFPGMLFAWAIANVQWETATFRTVDWLFVVCAVGLFAFGMWRFTVHWDARTKARDGLIAEQMTGQLLNRLIGPSCIVAHDLPCEGFNIDYQERSCPMTRRQSSMPPIMPCAAATTPDSSPTAPTTWSGASSAIAPSKASPRSRRTWTRPTSIRRNSTPS
jgi:hypothetical protein